MENRRASRRKAGIAMKFKRGQNIQTSSMPLTGWYLRWIPWAVSGFVCVGYLSGILTTQPLTLLSLLLLTGIYGGWLVIFHIGRLRQFTIHPPLWWLLALFCLACASQFIPLPNTDSDWLPLLPIITAAYMTMIKPRPLSLLAAALLFLSSYLAIRLIVPDWDISSQVGLLLAFLSIYAYGSIISELALAHIALEGANARLAEANTQLQEYNAQAEEFSAIRERNRIAREIHDTLGHALTLLSVQLETAAQLEARGDPRLHDELLEARQVAKSCLTDVRHSVEALRPDEASADSLQEQLQKLAAACEAICRETRITLDLEEATHPLNQELCQTLYRCAQEALTNIRKHARATKALLRLSTSGGEEGQVELTVLDNGQGYPSEYEQSAPGFGLRGMRERVALLDGTLRAGPEPGHGWRVEVVLPLKPRQPAQGSAASAQEIREKV
jgi:signal transduction histidine kinase